MQAFREIGALAEVGLLIIPRIQGGGVPLAPAGIEPLLLTLQSTRTFSGRRHRGPVRALVARRPHTAVKGSSHKHRDGVERAGAGLADVATG